MSDYKVTVTGPNDPTEIHKPGCKDLDNRRKFHETTWTVTVSSLRELAIEVWGDVASDELDEGSPEWIAQCEEWLASEYRIMPCAPQMPKETTTA